jgi:glycosyltransferase involved in cell wall biosynthesis
MKIAIFHNVPAGGAKRVIYEEVKGLSKKHELTLFEFSSTDENFLDIRPYVKKTLRFKFNIESQLPFFLNRLEKDYLNFIKLKKIHRQMAQIININFDAAIIHPDKFTESPFLLRYLKVPNIYYSHELLRLGYEKELKFTDKVFFLKRYYENITRFVRKEIDKTNSLAAKVILTNSFFIKRKIKSAYGRNSVICYPGVDIKVFKKRRLPRKKQILFIGNKVKIDGWDIVAAALSKIPTDIRPNVEILDFKHEGPKIANDVTLAKMYSQSIATICADFNEPFGLKAIESMACQTPVIAVNEGGYKETVVDGQTGYLISRNADILAKKIIFFVKNPEILEKIGKSAREHSIKNFSWRTHLNILERELNV